MNIYAYIECVTECSASDTATLYRWSLSGAERIWGDVQSGTEEELLQWLADITHPIVLIVPGDKVVSQQVPYSEKEKRYFAKMLPYELEEHVIGDVDNLHFAMGKVQSSSSTITTAYIDKQWFENTLEPFEAQHLSISHCIANFQQLKTQKNETVFWFFDETLWCHSDSGEGFSGESGRAETILQSFFSQVSAQKNEADIESAEQYSIYISSESNTELQDKCTEIKRIFHTLAPEKNIRFYEGAPALSLMNAQAIDFCCGPYKNKKSTVQQAKEYKWLGGLAAVAVLAFIIVNLIDIYLLTSQNQYKEQQIHSVARTVIPVGNIQHNPVRQLANKLGKENVGSEDASQVVYLLSNIAPVIQALDVDLATINYSHKEKTMRLNIQAHSFKQVEKLRADINDKGLHAELLSSNAIDDKFQARIRVSLEAR